MINVDAVIEPSKIFTPKNIVRFVVGRSTTFVVTAAITSLVPVESKTQKVKLYIGSYIIGEMVADKAKDYACQVIDSLLEKAEAFTEGDETPKVIDAETPEP